MFFQHLSHMTPPPSMRIHRPSSMLFSQFRQFFTFAARRFDDSGRALPRPGLVCERMGSFGRMLSRWPSCGCASVGLETDVGDVVAGASRSTSAEGMCNSAKRFLSDDETAFKISGKVVCNDLIFLHASCVTTGDCAIWLTSSF